MDRWVGKVAIVTGASSGIGAAITEGLVKAGVTVVGLARRSARLEELSSSLEGTKGKLHVKQCDVRKEDELLGVFEWVNSQLGGVDILVNNAGLSSNSKIINDGTDNFRNILDVNVLATTISIREAVASMKKRDVAGYIININSVVGHYVPATAAGISLYAASKFAVTALTETVRKELAAEDNDKIKITSLSPGVVKTEFADAAGYGSAQAQRFYDVAAHLDAKDISDAVIYLLETRDKVQVTELTIRPAGAKF